jgi:hypothetical protein
MTVFDLKLLHEDADVGDERAGGDCCFGSKGPRLPFS